MIFITIKSMLYKLPISEKPTNLHLQVEVKIYEGIVETKLEQSISKLLGRIDHFL